MDKGHDTINVSPGREAKSLKDGISTFLPSERRSIKPRKMTVFVNLKWANDIKLWVSQMTVFLSVLHI